MRSPLGSLPTPAEALDAPDWPAGGFDTQPGERPRVHVPRRSGDLTEAEAPTKPAPILDEQPVAEAKPERSSIAAFFGFGAKPPTTDSEPADSKPSRKGWWQKGADK